MEKVLVSIYHTYGKFDGKKLSERYAIEDTTENRQELMEENFWDMSMAWDSPEDFANGKLNAIRADLAGGDWDDPTGAEIVINTQESALGFAKSKYDKEVQEINSLFESESEKKL